ncbi:hypothetical protein [Francisella sp. 19X1-34]|uniref:hypothetical protein n=1 Tax=Francisella sp. 19X1-34 TaxID=3087177 RepID=UPI002E33D9B9|nr:hypothetical protein [Francisella sp. 19X1-34]MED7787743.1 hypothetical protein [Francisella sp. 19X1-34]
MKNIKLLSLSITTLALISCSTSADDQFKYVTPPPTQQNIDTSNTVISDKQEPTSNKLEVSSTSKQKL